MDIIAQRIGLRALILDDAPFILRLLNDPGWLHFIGDRSIRNIKDATDYILSGPMSMYNQYGHGLLLVYDLESLMPLGLCGLLQREHLNDPDLGFAMLAESVGKGLAYEAAKALLHHETTVHKRSRIWAYTKPHNLRSQRLLLRLGFDLHPQPPNVVGDDCYFLYSTEL